MNKRILNILNVSNPIIAMYGSRVYNTHTYGSDYDYIVIHDELNDHSEIRNGDLNLHTYKKETFQNLLQGHHIVPLEVYFNSEELRKTFKFDLDLVKLRHEISAKSSNSWVKCKKKLTVEPDEYYYVGVKSLWHSLRIILFGIQIATEKKIFDYTQANSLYDDIVKTDKKFTWDELKDLYQPTYNHYMTEFRKLAQKT